MECDGSYCADDPEFLPNYWYMTKSPLPIGLILAVYLCIVYKCGPKYMENKKAYNFKLFLVIYNIFQVFACIHIITTILSTGIPVLKFWKCRIYELNSKEEITLSYLTYFTLWLKICELIETVLFVLRKKQNQVTFLHVFHHCSTVILVYLLMKYVRGGAPMFPILLNCFVHIIMYSYYLVAAIASPQLQKQMVPLKKIITTIQMIQFCFILLQVIVQVIVGCPMNYYISTFYFTCVSVIFYLFYDFFKTSYKNDNNKQRSNNINNNSNGVTKKNVDKQKNKIK